LKGGYLAGSHVNLGGGCRDLEEGVLEALKGFTFFVTRKKVVVKVGYEHGLTWSDVLFEITDNAGLRVTGSNIFCARTHDK